MDEDKIVEYLKGISQSCDLSIEDRDALSIAIESVRIKNKTIHIVTLLEALSKEGFERQIFDYCIWKLVCRYLSYIIPKERKQACVEECTREIEKWVVDV